MKLRGLRLACTLDSAEAQVQRLPSSNDDKLGGGVAQFLEASNACAIVENN